MFQVEMLQTWDLVGEFVQLVITRHFPCDMFDLVFQALILLFVTQLSVFISINCIPMSVSVRWRAAHICVVCMQQPKIFTTFT